MKTLIHPRSVRLPRKAVTCLKDKIPREGIKVGTKTVQRYRYWLKKELAEVGTLCTYADITSGLSSQFVLNPCPALTSCGFLGKLLKFSKFLFLSFSFLKVISVYLFGCTGVS